MEFKYKTRREYEDELRGSCETYCLECNELSEKEYDELVDEFIEFCEVSGSGE